MPTVQSREISPSQYETYQSEFDVAQSTVASFAQEELFADMLYDRQIDPTDRTTYEYADALSQYADAYCETHAEMYDPKTLEEITLIAHAPFMMHIASQAAGYEATRKQKGYLDKQEYAELNDIKPYAVWYNQRLSGYMQQYDSARFSDIIASLSDSARENSPFSAEDIDEMVTAIARGARTEVVSRQLLETAGIPFSLGSGEDDLHGGDILVKYKDKTLKVDIKSSLLPIAKLLGKGDIEVGHEIIEEKKQMYAITNYKRDKYGAIVVYPGVTDQDLGNTCRLPDDIASAKATQLSIQLQRAFNEMKL